MKIFSVLLITIFSCVFCTQSVKAAFGISPVRIKCESLPVGVQCNTDVFVMKMPSDGEHLISLKVEAPAIESWIGLENPGPINFSAKDSKLKIPVKIIPPPSAVPGIYKGIFCIYTQSVLDQNKRNEIKMDIEVEVVDSLKSIEEPIMFESRYDNLHFRLQGKILIKTEDLGKAYYVHPRKKEIYYLGRPEDAFRVMREQGIGISNLYLDRIKLGILDYNGPDDQDGDGLSDAFEDAIKTDKHNPDTDSDGYNDKEELLKGYSPTKKDALLEIGKAGLWIHAGIFLQVEDRGEAWYMNLEDKKRYFLGRPAEAFDIMRRFGLGISNKDFNELAGIVD
jgi:hypothetical protein